MDALYADNHIAAEWHACISMCTKMNQRKTLCVRKANEKEEKFFMEIMTIFHVTLCRLSAAVL